MQSFVHVCGKGREVKHAANHNTQLLGKLSPSMELSLHETHNCIHTVIHRETHNGLNSNITDDATLFYISKSNLTQINSK